MRTITIAAYNRPDYLAQVLESLQFARTQCPEYAAEAIVLGIDPGAGEEAEIIRVAASMLPGANETDIRMIVWPYRLGTDEHTRRLLQYAFMRLHSDFNLHLEDDTVLSPDALRLVMWYALWNVKTSCCLQLYSGSRGGEDPSNIVRRTSFAPWGWACFNRDWHQWIAPDWNHKREQPYGWDWSLSRAMWERKLYALAPALSRVRNIGRERGVHQTPEGYDKDFGNQVCAGVGEMRKDEDFTLDPALPAFDVWKHGC
jgi:hypothetical protein